MFRSKFTTILLALTAMLALGASSAAFAGTITGTVTGADGKPAAGVQVRLQKAKEAGNGAKKLAKNAPTEKLAKNAAAPGADKPKAPKAGAMTATTSADGTFKFENVADGNYTVTANGKTLGMGKADVTVSGDTPANVTIALEAKAPAKKK